MLLAISLLACGSSETSELDTTAVLDLSQLPKATGPMADASESISAMNLNLHVATTGMVIGTTDSSFFSSSSSPAACETFNLFREAVTSASQADMIICFVGYMNDYFSSGVTDEDGNPVSDIDIYDGEYHIFNLTITGDAGAPGRVKMKLTKNAAGESIESFEMFMCALDGEDLVQNEYVSQTISDSNELTMTARGQSQDTDGSGWHAVVAGGMLDDSGAYLSKTIQITHSGEWGDYGPSWGTGTLVQAGSGFSFSGYRANLYNEEVNYDAAYSGGEVLNATSSSPLLMALGDGAANHESSWDIGGIDSWDGDTGLSVEINDFTTAASTEEVPTVSETQESIAFEPAQGWDCSDDVSVGILTMPEVQFSDMMTACSDYSMEHSWIDCGNLE